MKKGQANQIENLDQLFLTLSKKVNLNSGENLLLKDQLINQEQRQAELQEEAIGQHILVQINSELRKTLGRDVYHGMMQLMEYNYSADLTDSEEDTIRMQKRKRNIESFREVFHQVVIPQLEIKLNDVAKNLKYTLLISEGESADEMLQKEEVINELVQHGSKQEIEEILQQQVPLHKKVQLMQSNIDKVKVLLQKSKDLKESLKQNIYDVNAEIDRYIDMMGKCFILEGLATNQNSTIKLLEAEIQNLVLQQKQKIAEL